MKSISLNIALMVLALSVGCSSQFKKTPKPGETIKEDILLVGYQGFVDIDEDAEVVYRHLQDINNVARAFVWVELEKKDEDTDWFDAPGDGVHFSARVIGFPFKGRLVLTRADKPEHTEIFHVMSVWSRQQWWKENLEDGRGRLYLRIITEIPDIPFLSEVITPQVFANQSSRRIQFSLDRIKADIEGKPLPEKLPQIEKAELFTSTVRIYRTSILIKRPSAQVYKYITKLENFNRASEMLNFVPFTETDVLSKVGQQCHVVSTDASPFELSGRSIIVESRENGLIHHFIYIEQSIAGFIVNLKQKGAGNTILDYSFYYQIPDYSSEELMTTLHAVSRLDEALRLALDNIKFELESNPGITNL